MMLLLVFAFIGNINNGKNTKARIGKIYINRMTARPVRNMIGR